MRPDICCWPTGRTLRNCSSRPGDGTMSSGGNPGRASRWGMVPLLALAAAAGPLFAKFAGAIALAQCEGAPLRDSRGAPDGGQS